MAGQYHRPMDYISQQVNTLRRLPAKQSTGFNTLLALLCVLFLGAQIHGLSHSHEDNLNYQADCDVCLKLSSDDDAPIPSNTEFPTQISQQTSPQYTSADLAVELVKFRKARAPPSA